MSRSGQGFTTHSNSQSPIFTYISSCTHTSALEWQQLHLHNQGWVPRGLMLELSPQCRQGESSHLTENAAPPQGRLGESTRAAALQSVVMRHIKPSPATGCNEWLFLVRFISLGRASKSDFKMINTFAGKVHIKKILVAKQNAFKFAIYYFLLKI